MLGHPAVTGRLGALNRHAAGALLWAAVLGGWLAACQSIEPARPEPDPAQPPPAPITPPPESLPPHGQLVTAPLPGQPSPAPLLAPARIGWREAQRQLARLGYDPGPADGTVGRRTTAALRAFQRHHGLPASGRLDDATRQALTPKR
ncbi:peptidoglycan-binding domain-containing protein [Ottowia testudinis]|uniref:Peptidoglycan-binding protein n=1 Tax=Ottowia testudinis TaxID=2816950 RepID=A0A975H3M1_9BURK|nr:peptidoglycan-binding domain-containing protein [Ottowia testudinis]QTD45420.1 peptidoglycan-binding protein [Ottowia testudinis]